MENRAYSSRKVYNSFKSFKSECFLLFEDPSLVLNTLHFLRNLQSKSNKNEIIINQSFFSYRKPVATNSLLTKNKDQEKFNEYAINTDDAWEIDDRTMTLKILDNGDDSDGQSESVGISKQV